MAKYSNIKIVPVRTAEESDRIRQLFREYAVFLGVDLCFQRISPYYENPLPGVVYWQLDLS